MSDDNESVLVKLTRMEGKLDLSNLRHDQTEARLGIIDSRLNGHGDRIGSIEKREIGREGERKGIATSTKVLWAGVTLLSGGIGAAIMRISGAM